MNITEKFKQLIKDMNEKGVPTFVMRDPLLKQPSLTYTLCYVNGVIAIGGLLGRFANLVAGVDADAAKELLIVTGSLYLGRTITRSLSDTKPKEKTINE